MSLSEIISTISDNDIEMVYESVMGKTSAESGIVYFEKIKSVMYTYRSAYMAIGANSSVHRTFVSLEKNLKKITNDLDIYLREVGEGRKSTISQQDATSLVSNLHLIINGFKELASSIDRGM